MANNVISLDSDSDEEPTASKAVSKATNAPEANTSYPDVVLEHDNKSSDSFGFEECCRIVNNSLPRIGNETQGGNPMGASSRCSKGVQKVNTIEAAIHRAEKSKRKLDELVTKAISAIRVETEKNFHRENSLKRTIGISKNTSFKSQMNATLEKKLRTSRIGSSSNTDFKNSKEFDLPMQSSDQLIGSLAYENHEPSEMRAETTRNTVPRRWPSVGSLCYSMATDSLSKWVIHTITDLTHENDDQSDFFVMFHVETKLGGTTQRKKVAGDAVAYPDPQPNRPHVGCRVIAATNQIGCSVEFKSFYPGVIAELPTHLNGFRYLIFFETGHVQYCLHKDVRLVYKTRKRIGEYFTRSLSQFIVNYIEKFPHRSLFKTDVGSLISVERDGSWINAKVNQIDNAIMQILFENDGKHEWVYRGSPRLLPIFNRIEALSSRTRNRQVAEDARSNSLKENPPYIRSQSPREGIVSDSSSGKEDVSGIDSSSGWDVAEKSKSPVELGLVPSSPEVSQRVTRSASAIHSSQTPRPFFAHKCSRACVAWVRYHEAKTAGVAVLAIPSMFAFKREVASLSSEVAYIAPCGKRLSSLEDVLQYLSDTHITLSLSMFDFDYRTNVFNNLVVDPKHIVIHDISFGGEKIPIPCVNDLNNDCPDLMTYITERRALDDVLINTDPGFLICCDCQDNCRDKFNCQCFQHTVENYRLFNTEGVQRNFNNIGYEYQRLYQDIPSGIYECNSQCKCNPSACLNRVVQHEIKHKLQLFKTQKMGWGVRTAVDIPQGAFICTYTGNIMPEKAANEIGVFYGDEYFADLDHIEAMQQHKAGFEKNAATIPDEEESKTSLKNYPSGRARRSRTFDIKYTEPSRAKKKSELQSDNRQPGIRNECTTDKTGALQGDLADLDQHKAGFEKNAATIPDEEESNISPKNYPSGRARRSCTVDIKYAEQPRAKKKFDSQAAVSQRAKAMAVSQKMWTPNDDVDTVRKFYGPDETVYVMDAKIAGNISRYFNHSCDPNMFVQNVYVDTHDLRFPWVAFFALEHIPAGTELMWDYGYSIGSVPGKSFYCHCGSANCRKRLF